VVQPLRATTGCEAMRRRDRMMQMGLSHGSEDTTRFLRSVTAEAAEEFIGKDQACTIDPNTLM
jgi:hypothetical protein